MSLATLGRPSGITPDMVQPAASPRSTMRAYNAKLGKGDWHGVHGQASVSVLDIDSPCTGFGMHAKLGHPSTYSTGHGPRGVVEIDERPDQYPNLPATTDQDRRKVLYGDLRIHPESTPRLRYVGPFEWHSDYCGRVITHVYTWLNPDEYDRAVTAYESASGEKWNVQVAS